MKATMADTFDTKPDFTNLWTPAGVLDRFAKGTGAGPDTDVAPALKEAVAAMVKLYSSQGVKVFWSAADLAVAHVVVSNHLLAASDAEQLLTDVETYEVVFDKFGDTLMSLVTETSKSAYYALVKQLAELPHNHKSAVLTALDQALKLVGEPAVSELLRSSDDRELYRLVQAAKAKQSKPNYASIRIKLAIDRLQAEDGQAG